MAEDPLRGKHPIPEVEVEVKRTLVPDSSPPSPPPTTQPLLTLVALTTLVALVMDAVYALATTQASLDQPMTRVEVTIMQNHAMLLRIMSHLGLSPASEIDPTQPNRDQSIVAASLDMLAATAAASDPPTSPPPRE